MGSIGLPLAPIGLPPAPSQKLPWWEQKQVPSWERPQTPAWERQGSTPTFDLRRIPGWQQGNVAAAMLQQQHTQQQLDRQLRHGEIRVRPRPYGNYQPPVVYVLPAYGYSGIQVTTPYEVTPPSAPAETAPPEPALPMGALRLDVEPREDLQVFVDGVYVGTLADLGDEFDISSGRHHIELRSRGYKTLAFDVAITEGRTLSYRGSLERDAATPAPAVKPIVKPTGSRIMYVIPGCYVGNVSPKDVSLPAGCDISKLTTISPP